MNIGLKIGVALSALALLAACENAPGAGDNAAGAGANGINGQYPDGTGGQIPGTNIADRVFFAFNSSALSSEAQATLQRQAEWLKANEASKLTLEGHCDERGTREYNLALGERRANAARDYLTSLGVNASRVSVVSYGKERPAVVGSNEEAWAQNRRSVTVVAH